MHIVCSYFSAYGYISRNYTFCILSQHAPTSRRYCITWNTNQVHCANGSRGHFRDDRERGHIFTRTPHGCAINLPSLDVARSLRGEPPGPGVQPFLLRSLARGPWLLPCSDNLLPKYPLSILDSSALEPGSGSAQKHLQGNLSIHAICTLMQITPVSGMCLRPTPSGLRGLSKNLSLF